MRRSDGFPFAGRDRVLERVVSLAAPRPSMRILDIGTGTGDLAARFAVRRNCAVWGLDFSAGMLDRARTKLSGATFVQADLRSNWPLARQRHFDRMVSTYVFHEFALTEKIDLLRTMCHDYVLQVQYEQVSVCGGVFVVKI